MQQVSVDIFANGGEGIQHIARLAKEGDQLDSVRDVMKLYIERMGPSQAVPTEFVTGSWRAFGVSIDEPQLARRELVLPELYFYYRDNEVNFRRMGDLIRNLDAKKTEGTAGKWGDGGDDDVRGAMITSRQGVLDLLVKISDSAKACIASEEKCTLEAIKGDPVKIKWPQPDCDQQWTDKDDAGTPYRVRFKVKSENRDQKGAVIGEGSFELTQSNSEITKIQYFFGPEIGCRFSYPPDDGPNITTNGLRAFMWRRKWDGTPCNEGYDVFYRVAQNQCKAPIANATAMPVTSNEIKNQTKKLGNKPK